MSDWFVTVKMTGRTGERQLQVQTRTRGDDGVIAIGRASKNEICIPQGNVSRVHCFLIVRPDGVFIKDSGSTNGTWVNGCKVAGQSRFAPGDKLYLGDHVIELACAPTPAAPWQVRLELIEADQPPRVETREMRWTADDRHELELDECTLIINEAGGSWMQRASANARLAIDDELVEDTEPARFPVGAIARTKSLTVRLVERPIAPPGFCDT